MDQIALQNILNSYGLQSEVHSSEPFGSGLINHTWKIQGTDGAYILQQVNRNVFKQPQVIADNLNKLNNLLQAKKSDYLFVAPMPTVDGEHLVCFEGEYYRLFPFISNSHTVNYLTHSAQAYEAARQFGSFAALFDGFDLSDLGFPIKQFHDLSLRLQQFEEALQKGNEERKARAAAEINQVKALARIATLYNEIVSSSSIPLRVMHHDTKISNVLFDPEDKGLCVIDLDTVMPGYFISDVGDMMRTYLAEASEEETDLDKIQIRDNFFEAIYTGYNEGMGAVLTTKEKELFIYAGEFMIYMQAVRFLTDYLNNDTYYSIKYPGHNLMRAKNQLRLLQQYLAHEANFLKIIGDVKK